MTISKLKYPAYNTRNEIAVSASVVALLVYLFLALFQPFGTYNYIHTGKYLLLVPYAIIAFALFFTGDYFISKYFTQWTWINEGLKNIVLLLLCSLFNYWYNIYFINDAGFSLRALSYMVIFTYTLGIPVCAIAVLGKYSFLKNVAPQTEVTAFDVEVKTEAERNILIVPDVGAKMSLSKTAFLYAQSEGNYSNIFYLNNEQVEKKLLRIALKNLEEQICNDQIIRCHRSYILNLQHASSKQGNAQGFKISLKFMAEKVPVSRKYIDKINNISF